MRTITKAVSLAAAGAFAVMTLSGCIRMQADLYVGQDATIEKAGIVYALDKEKLAAMGQLGGGEMFTLDEFKKQALKDDTTGAMAKACTFTETRAEMLMACTFTEDSGLGGSTIPLGGTDTLTLEKKDGVITAVVPADAFSTGSNPLNGGDSIVDDGPSQEEISQMSDMMGMKAELVLHFPGAVQTVSAGAVIDSDDPNAARIDLLKTAAAKEDVTVTALAGTGGSLSSILVTSLVIVGFIIGGAVVLALFMRRRQAAGDEPADDSVATPWTPAPAADGAETAAPTQEAAPSAPPQYSADGKWWWDGQQWVPAPQAPPSI